MGRLITMIRWVGLLLPALALADGAPASPGDPRPALLKSLDGEWLMSGDVRGEPVTYALVAQPTLGGAFTELHMRDVAQPPAYEARVFIGWDADSGTVIAHWLDSFGARYSVPHGVGRISGDTLEFTIPYADGPFRDTFVFVPARDTWELRIEAAQPDGGWAHFARYQLQRR
jgi:hypothetical protein